MSSKEKIDDSFVQEYAGMVAQIVSEYSRKYKMVERADLSQEIWMWFVTHPRKFNEWSQMPDQKDTDRLIAKSLRNQAHDFCVKEKARLEGYNPDDLFYYRKEFIKMMIPAVLSDDWQKVESVLSNLSGRGGSKPASESGDWMAYSADIRLAFDKLDEKEQNLVFLFYGEDVDSHTLHDMVEGNDRPTARATAMAANRALNKMVRTLGGPPSFRDEDYIDAEEESVSDL